MDAKPHGCSSPLVGSMYPQVLHPWIEPTTDCKHGPRSNPVLVESVDVDPIKRASYICALW